MPDTATNDPMRPESARVWHRRAEIADTWTLEIEAAGRAFAPGQFNMLYAFGVGEIPISISGDPSEPRRQAHTIRAVGAVSRALASLRAGDELGLRGPFGNGWPVTGAEGRDVILVAGGLGLAPLRPALYHILRHRERYARVSLLYGARRPADRLFRDELAAWQGEGTVEVRVTVDHAGADWDGNVGPVPGLIPAAVSEPDETVALVCGPEVMLRFTADALADAGVDPAAVYVSMERNMHCAIGHCGHCQFGPTFICRDGPVLAMDRVGPLLRTREI